MAVPLELSHQGRLMENGVPLMGAHDLVVSLHTAASGGSVVFSETWNGYTFDDGYFAVNLGTDALGNPLDSAAFDPDDLWVQVEVDGTVLADRVKIASVPFAIRADVAGTLESGAVIDVFFFNFKGTTVIDTNGDFQGTGLDTLAELSCAFGEVAVFGGTDWVCSTVSGSGGGPVAWTDILGIPTEIADGDDDSFADKTCPDGQILVYRTSFPGWACSPLDWDELTNVPAGFQDGVDDILDESAVDTFVANNGYALDADLAAIATSGDWNDLSNVPADFLDGVDNVLDEAAVDAFVANNGYAMDADIAAVGKTGNWTDLLGVPADFSDGIDNVLDEAAVDAFVGNNGYALDADISTVGKSGDWADLGSIPGGFADGVDNELTESDVETFIENGSVAISGTVGIGDDGASCVPGINGTVRWTGTALEVCQGTLWQPVWAGQSVGQTQADAEVDCAAVQAAGATENGIYWIDPNGGGTGDAFQAYCEMDTLGGGWTLAMNVNPSDGGSVRFSNTVFWTSNQEYGDIGDHFTHDYKSPASFELTATEILVVLANIGANGSVIGWKAWNLTGARTYDSFFDSGANTVQTSGITGSDTTNVYAYEPLVKFSTQLRSNMQINPNNDRSRLAASSYSPQGDDNQPGLGTMMNQNSGLDTHRYADVELWVNSGSNLWCTHPSGAGQYKYIGSDYGCGRSCDGCVEEAEPGYFETWTYRIYVR